MKARPILDGLSTAAILFACAVIVWSFLRASPPERANLPLPSGPVSLAGTASLGSLSAPVVLLVFSDFQCPACARFANEVLSRLEPVYIATGKVRLHYRHFPLERIHPLALRAALAADCAGAVGRFWEYHKTLFINQANISEPNLKQWATEVGVSAERYADCTAPPRGETLRGTVQSAQDLGVYSTPSLYVGEAAGPEQMIVRSALRGGRKYEEIVRSLDLVLAR